jgi:hypothetical protein
MHTPAWRDLTSASLKTIAGSPAGEFGQAAHTQNASRRRG